MAVTKGSIAGPVVGVVGPGPGSEDSDLIVGGTTITGGSNGNILYDNNGVLGEETISQAVDVLGATQGDILYRSATGWVVLAPDTAGKVLTTNGVLANPSWIDVAAGLVTAGAGITITGTSPATISLIVPVTAVLGGTGQITYALGDTLYASALNTLSKLPGNITSGIQYLAQTGNGAVSAAPAWTTISGGDITGAALTRVNDTNVTLTLGGTPTAALLRAASLTLGWTGQLGLSRGGSNANLTADNGGIVYSDASALAILAHNAAASKPLLSGASAAPTWAGISYPTTAISGGIPYFSSTTAISSSALLTANAIVLGGGAASAPISLGSLGTTTTVLHGNAAGAPTFSAVSLTADVSGILPSPNGGTGIASPTVHGLLIANGASVMTQLAPSATSGVPLVSQGSSSDPAYSTAVVAGGGSGRTSATAYAVICGGTTSTAAHQSVAALGSSGDVFTSNGAGALPTFQTPSASSASALGVVRLCYFTGAWRLFAPDGSSVSIAGSTTSGLQEAINYAQVNGYNLDVQGPSPNNSGSTPAQLICTTAVFVGPATYKSYKISGCTISFTAVTGNTLNFNTLSNCIVHFDCTIFRTGGNAGDAIVAIQPNSPEPVFGGKIFQGTDFFINTISHAGSVSGNAQGGVVFAMANTYQIVNNKFRFGTIDGGPSSYIDAGININDPPASSAFNDNDVSWMLLVSYKLTGLVVGGGAGTGILASNRWAGSMESAYATTVGHIRTDEIYGTYMLTSMDVDAGTCGTGITFTSLSSKCFFKITQIVATTFISDSGTGNRGFYNGKTFGGNPTKQVFTSGSGTYTLPAYTKYITVTVVGGGGGGGGSGTAVAGTGAAGNVSTFGSSFLTANGGGGGLGTGTGSVIVGGTATGGDVNYTGQSGGPTVFTGGVLGGPGGNTTFIGGGGTGGWASAGGNATTNSGGGGGGAGHSAGPYIGGGGGGGGACEKLISAPSATYAYVVGASATGGTAGTSGFAGGVGAAGIIVVDEYYW